MVQPPGEFNDVIPEPLPIHSENFMILVQVFSHNVDNKQMYKQTLLQTQAIKDSTSPFVAGEV